MNPILFFLHNCAKDIISVRDRIAKPPQDRGGADHDHMVWLWDDIESRDDNPVFLFSNSDRYGGRIVLDP